MGQSEISDRPSGGSSKLKSFMKKVTKVLFNPEEAQHVHMALKHSPAAAEDLRPAPRKSLSLTEGHSHSARAVGLPSNEALKEKVLLQSSPSVGLGAPRHCISSVDPMASLPINNSPWLCTSSTSQQHPSPPASPALASYHSVSAGPRGSGGVGRQALPPIAPESSFIAASRLAHEERAAMEHTRDLPPSPFSLASALNSPLRQSVSPPEQPNCSKPQTPLPNNNKSNNSASPRPSLSQLPSSVTQGVLSSQSSLLGKPLASPGPGSPSQSLLLAMQPRLAALSSFKPSALTGSSGLTAEYPSTAISTSNTVVHVSQSSLEKTVEVTAAVSVLGTDLPNIATPPGLLSMQSGNTNQNSISSSHQTSLLSLSSSDVPGLPILSSPVLPSPIRSALMRNHTHALGNNNANGSTDGPMTPHSPLSPAVTELMKARHTLLHVSPMLPAAVGSPGTNWALADFTLERKLYKGYASSVYKAITTRTQHPVALKVYSLENLSEFLNHQVYREVEVHRRVHHPNVVAMHAVFKEGKHLVLVQEYARGGCLMRVLRKLGGRLSEKQAVDIVVEPLMNALVHLHAQGIIHRDIKPENILFTSDWQLKLADFGVAIDLNAERAVTRTGTPVYMAPEVQRCPLKRTAADNKDDPRLSYTTAVDVFSIGVLTYELLVGFPPTLPQDNQNTRKAPNAATDAPIGNTDCNASCEILIPGLAFPNKVSAAARSFICAALQPDPGSRPTVQSMLEHPWVEAARAARVNLQPTLGQPGSGIHTAPLNDCEA